MESGRELPFIAGIPDRPIPAAAKERFRRWNRSAPRVTVTGSLRNALDAVGFA